MRSLKLADSTTATIHVEGAQVGGTWNFSGQDLDDETVHKILHLDPLVVQIIELVGQVRRLGKPAVVHSTLLVSDLLKHPFRGRAITPEKD